MSKKGIEYYMNLPYKMEIVFDPSNDTFVVKHPELPGCFTAGRTIEEAIANAEEAKRSAQSSGQNYIANTNSHKFHYPWCASVKKMKESNKWYYHGTRDQLISHGYTPCKNCKP